MPAIILPLAISGPNALLGAYACLVLRVGLGMLWRPGEPPILLFVFLYQWLQSAAGAIYGNIIGIPISDLVQYQGRHEFASGLMLTGVLVLAIAMHAAAGNAAFDLNMRMRGAVRTKPFGFWLRVYALAWVFSAMCGVLAPMAGGLKLLLITMSQIKWAAFVLLTFAAFVGPRRSDVSLWLVVFAIEFVLSVGGFFSTFKDVFYFALFGLVATNVRMGSPILVPGAILGCAMIALGLIWTAIKTDYRDFVNAGTGQQVVLVDYGERVQELTRLIGQLDGESMRLASDDYISRLMYHQFLGVVAAKVPRDIPYAGGEIWGEAVARPFMPRLIFPSKREINDSDLTNKYTGLNVAGREQGTSISLGYMAEAYIDFGPITMFAAIAGLGFGLGLFYRWLLNQPGPMAIVGAALAPFALMPAHLAETSVLTMISSLVLTFLACLSVLKVLAPMALGSASKTRAI